MFVSKKKDALPRGIPLVLFFAIASLLSAQDAQPFGEPREPVAAAQAASQPRQGRETNESLILINPASAYGEGASDSGSSARAYSPAGAILRLVAVLILLCVACFFIIRFLRKSPRAVAGSDPFLKLAASLSLEQGKSVAVVTLGGRAFLLGVADHSVSLIAEIADAELVDQMNLSSGASTASKKGFAEMLFDLMPKSRKEGRPASGESGLSSAQETAAFIRRRRESLKDNEGAGQ